MSCWHWEGDVVVIDYQHNCTSRFSGSCTSGRDRARGKHRVFACRYRAAVAPDFNFRDSGSSSSSVAIGEGDGHRRGVSACMVLYTEIQLVLRTAREEEEEKGATSAKAVRLFFKYIEKVLLNFIFSINF